LQHPGDISIVGGAATGERKSRRERLAELLDFANETFLHDQDLAQQHALNITIEGLYSEQYWVSCFCTATQAGPHANFCRFALDWTNSHYQKPLDYCASAANMCRLV